MKRRPFCGALAAAAFLLLAPGPLIPLLGGRFFGFILPLAAAAFFLAASAFRLFRWLKTPVPYNVALPTGQASGAHYPRGQSLRNPPGRGLALLRLILEAVSFKALWRNFRLTRKADYPRDPRLALAALAFHFLFLAIIIGHIRYFWPNPPAWLFVFDPPPILFGLGLIASLAALIALRLRPPLRLFAQAADFWPLALIISLAGTGIGLLSLDFDPAEARRLVWNLLRLRCEPVELPALFYLHLCQFSALLVWLPLGRGLHGLGYWLTPTLNGANNARRVRHRGGPQQPVTVLGYQEYERKNAAGLLAAGLSLEYPENEPGERVS